MHLQQVPGLPKNIWSIGTLLHNEGLSVSLPLATLCGTYTHVGPPAYSDGGTLTIYTGFSGDNYIRSCWWQDSCKPFLFLWLDGGGANGSILPHLPCSYDNRITRIFWLMGTVCERWSTCINKTVKPKLALVVTHNLPERNRKGSIFLLIPFFEQLILWYYQHTRWLLFTCNYVHTLILYKTFVVNQFLCGLVNL